ncbi:MAG: T9SS type A sorting domain-containing protein, partial [Dinghuibacter sp.]|nr:T9SS type A sorting domain-containing protein [Dinghuibacter sp.]
SSLADTSSYSETSANVTAASLFVNAAAGNLNINTANANAWYANNKAIAGALSGSINNDYGGGARGTTVGTPTDIGADEFNVNVGVLPPIVTASAAPALSTTTTYSFGGRTLGQITWGAAGTVPTQIDWRYYSGITPAISGATPINSYHDVVNTNNNGSGYTYDMKLYFTDAEKNQLTDAALVGMKDDGSGYVDIGGTFGSDAAGKFTTSTSLSNFSRFSLKTGIIVPLQIISFSGNPNNTGGVDVQWNIAQQNGVLQYTVERSASGSIFSAIGSRAANGLNNGSYTLTDAQPFTGKNFYRLKITHNNGRVSYSHIVLVNLNSKGELVLYPNPASTQVILNIGKPELLNTNITVMDVQGKTVMQQKLVQVTELLNVAALQNGVYFICFADGTVLRFTKQ